MIWLNNKLINKSEVARRLKITPIALYAKIKNKNGNKITASDLEKLESIRKQLKSEL